jgi:CubicO group peptidase (beta-lactamase class C family)
METLRAVLAQGLPTPTDRGVYPAAVAAVAWQGHDWPVVAVGEAVRYADRDGGLLPPGQRRVATGATIFDLASLTKIFTTVLLLRRVERGQVDLDEPVGRILPEIPAPLGRLLTPRHLITHTGGYPPGRPEARHAPDPWAAWRLVATTPPLAAPGTAFRYSDIGPIMLGVLIERVSGADRPGRPPGAGLADLVRDEITGPLRMTDTGYLPGPHVRPRIAATEAVAGDRARHGEVHDETAHTLGGVAGNAGIFGTAADVRRFGEMLRLGGAVPPEPGPAAPGLPPRRVPRPRAAPPPGRVLAAESVRMMVADHVPVDLAPPTRHGLGVRLAAPWFMGPLADTSFGHTGFTGTSLVVDPARQVTVVLLTNRVHPSRDWSQVDPVRRALAAVVLEVAEAGGWR